MKKTPVSLLLLFLLFACGGTSLRAPTWFAQPPKDNPKFLYFVGDASDSPDEGTARDLAIQKALAELTVYCGANVTSDFKSLEREANGKYEQVVSMTVDVAGDEITIREAVIKETIVGRSGKGFGGYAMIEWPKSQYQAVMAAQRQRAERALALFLESTAAFKDQKLSLAKDKHKEARTTLGPMKTQIPIRHKTYENSALLYDAIEAFGEVLDRADKERRRVFSVAVKCSHDKEAKDCVSERIGAVREQVSKLGFKVSADSISPTVIQSILASDSPETDATVRSSGFVLAVRYDSKHTAKEDGIHYVHCAARGVMYDTDASRIVAVKEISPAKGGHPKLSGAIKLGCRKAQKAMLQWVETELTQMN